MYSNTPNISLFSRYPDVPAGRFVLKYSQHLAFLVISLTSLLVVLFSNTPNISLFSRYPDVPAGSFVLKYSQTGQKRCVFILNATFIVTFKAITHFRTQCLFKTHRLKYQNVALLLQNVTINVALLLQNVTKNVAFKITTQCFAGTSGYHEKSEILGVFEYKPTSRDVKDIARNARCWEYLSTNLPAGTSGYHEKSEMLGVFEYKPTNRDVRISREKRDVGSI